MYKKTYIIAEAGINHNGSLKKAYELIKKSKLIGADAIKFQTFKSENVVTKYAAKAKYQKKLTNKNESQLEMIKKYQFNQNEFKKLYDFSKKLKIDFLSSAFDNESLFFLNSLGLKTFKIPSGEITNLPYLEIVGQFKKKVILSTGMSTLDEINKAVNILVSSGTNKKNITILQCHSDYPTKYKDVNLNAIKTIKNKFGVNVGFSDHTLGSEVALGAIAYGARIIDKHFTLNKKLSGPDHSSSLEPHEFKKLIIKIRNLEQAFGSYIKKPSNIESKNKLIVRKSIVAKTSIKKGQIFTVENITIKRPGNGISPMKWYKVLGSKSKHDYKIDQIIK